MCVTYLEYHNTLRIILTIRTKQTYDKVCYLLVEIHKNCIFSGAGLMGFYRIHMLDVIAVEFLIVPLILLVGGVYTFFTALFGVYATMREDSCLVTFFRVCAARGASQRMAVHI